jgi:hypothetical protein
MYKVGKQEEQNKPLAIVNAVDQSEQSKKNQMKSLSSGGQFFYGGLSGYVFFHVTFMCMQMFIYSIPTECIKNVSHLCGPSHGCCQN